MAEREGVCKRASRRPNEFGPFREPLDASDLQPFRFIRLFSSVRARFRVLPTQCHSKCHSPERVSTSIFVRLRSGYARIWSKE